MKERFITYIERSLPDRPGDKILFQIKREMLDEMTAMDKTVEKRGLRDEKVREDLIISEYPDLPGRYAAYYDKKTEKQRTKRNFIANAIGSAAYILLLLVAFLGISFATDAWGRTWVIMVDGILLWIDYLLMIGVVKITSMRRVFHIFARILLGIAVMVAAVAVFLVCMAVLHMPYSWLIIIAGIAAVFAADSIYISVTRQKLAVIFYLAYIPAAAAMVYILLGAPGIIPWAPGWIMIPLSLLIDAAIIAALILRNKKIAREVAKHWNED